MDLPASLCLITILLSALCQICCSQTLEVFSEISSPELGQSFTFKCTVTNNQQINPFRPDLDIYRKTADFNSDADDGELVIKQPLNADLTALGDTAYGTGLSQSDRNRLTFNSSTFTLTLTGTSCADVGMRYRCVPKWGIQGQPDPFHVEDSKMLMVKARPQKPTMSQIPDPLSVVENENPSFRCTANVGRPNKGDIRWRISAQGMSPIIAANGDQNVQQTSAQNPDPSCTEVLVSTLTLPDISRSYQNFSVACYVSNSDFQTAFPSACTDPDTDLCQTAGPIVIYYEVTSPTVTKDEAEPYETSSVTLTCKTESFPAPTYSWVKVGDENRTLVAVMVGDESKLTLTNLSLTTDEGEYNCTATNSFNGDDYSVTETMMLSISPTTTTQSTTTSTTTVPPTPKTDKTSEPADDSSDSSTIIIAVCVSLAVVLIIIVVVGYFLYKRRNPKQSVIEEPSEKPYKHNLSFQNPQPDLVADEKKFNNPSLNSSFQNEDGLMYADLTYDNRPRSRKPMALGDTVSEYSDVQMPSV